MKEPQKKCEICKKKLKKEWYRNIEEPDKYFCSLKHADEYGVKKWNWNIFLDFYYP